MASTPTLANEFQHIRNLSLTPDRVSRLTISEEGDGVKVRLYGPQNAQLPLSRAEIKPFAEALADNILLDHKLKGLNPLERPEHKIELKSGTVIMIRGNDLLGIFEKVFADKLAPVVQAPVVPTLSNVHLPKVSPKIEESPVEVVKQPVFDPLKFISKYCSLLEEVGRKFDFLQVLQNSSPDDSARIDTVKQSVVSEISAWMAEVKEGDVYNLNRRLAKPHPELDNPWMFDRDIISRPLDFGGAVTICMKSAILLLPYADAEKLLIPLLKLPESRSQAILELFGFSTSLRQLQPRDSASFIKRLQLLDTALSEASIATRNRDDTQRIDDAIGNIRRYYS